MNAYEVLGVTTNTSGADIRVAYLALVRKYHPDINKAPGATKKLQQINAAYDLVKEGKPRTTSSQNTTPKSSAPKNVEPLWMMFDLEDTFEIKRFWYTTSGYQYVAYSPRGVCDGLTITYHGDRPLKARIRQHKRWDVNGTEIKLRRKVTCYVSQVAQGKDIKFYVCGHERVHTLRKQLTSGVWTFPGHGVPVRRPDWSTYMGNVKIEFNVLPDPPWYKKLFLAPLVIKDDELSLDKW